MKSILIVLGIIITFSSCYNKRMLPYHMAKEKPTAAETCNTMFPPKIEKEIITKMDIVYRDTTIGVALPFSKEEKGSALKLPETLKDLEGRLGFNPCDSCYSETVTVQTPTSTATGTVSRGKQVIIITEKDSLSIEIRLKETIINQQERILNEYERSYISKQAKLEEMTKKYTERGVWSRIWFWMFIVFLIVAVIEFYIIKWSPSKWFK